MRMTQIIEELLPGHPAAALTGPNLAREIMAGQAAASVIATDDLGVAAALQAVLQHRLFRVYRNHDVIGCEIGGALKNVIAIAAGIGEGLGRRRQHPGRGDDPGPGRADPPGRGHGRRAADPRRPGRHGRPGGHLHEPLQPEPHASVSCSDGASRWTRSWRRCTWSPRGSARHAPPCPWPSVIGVELPICQEIHKVVMGQQRPVDAYRGLRPAGHEADPG